MDQAIFLFEDDELKNYEMESPVNMTSLMQMDPLVIEYENKFFSVKNISFDPKVYLLAGFVHALLMRCAARSSLILPQII